MRIISGIYRGRKLTPPASQMIRPTSDRGKETLFNVLNNLLDFRGIQCFDLFCGTGSLGLECISRGASNCIFVDSDIKLVEKNIALLNAQKTSRIYKLDALRFLMKHPDLKAELILSDPPYNYENYDELIEIISKRETVFALEHAESFILDSKYERSVVSRKTISSVNFTIFDFN